MLLAIVPLTEFNECVVYVSSHSTLFNHQVILHSKSYSLAAQCVFTLLTLMYPLQYLFPVIPLLPSCMPSAENVLKHTHFSSTQTQTRTSLSLTHTHHVYICNMRIIVSHHFSLSTYLVANGSHSVLFWSVFVVP